MPEEYRKRGDDDDFYRAVRYCVEKLAPDKKSLNLEDKEWHSMPFKMLSILGPSNRPTFRINRDYQQAML